MCPGGRHPHRPCHRRPRTWETGPQQNELGDAFSSEIFLANLAAPSPAARRPIFGGAGIPGLDQRITNRGRMASITREGGRAFANPSGTPGATGHMANIGALVAGLTIEDAPVVAGAIVAPAGANMLARVAANPRYVRFAAERTQLTEGATGSRQLQVEPHAHGGPGRHHRAPGGLNALRRFCGRERVVADMKSHDGYIKRTEGRCRSGQRLSWAEARCPAGVRGRPARPQWPLQRAQGAAGLGG